MSPASDTMEQLRQQADELYWNSAETVDQLASRLGLSRNAVYGSVQPIPAGAPCIECGEPLMFTNRTNRASRLGSCLSCEAVLMIEEEVADAAAAALAGMAGGDTEPNGLSRWRQWRAELATVPPERAAKIGGLAAIGAAVGAAAVKAIRNRT